jgi:hypothetical protein
MTYSEDYLIMPISGIDNKFRFKELLLFLPSRLNSIPPINGFAKLSLAFIFLIASVRFTGKTHKPILDFT